MNILISDEAYNADLDDMSPHTPQERFDVVNRVRIHELSIVEPKAYPKVVH